MNRREIVKQWVAKNDKPEREFCPEINQYFTTSNGYEIWNSRTGIREACGFNPTTWNARKENHFVNLLSVRPSYDGFYVRFIKEMDCLEVAYVIMKGNRGQNGILKTWKYYYGYRANYSRYFIFRDGVVYNSDGKECPANVGGRYNKEVYKDIHSWHSLNTSMVNYKELAKFDRNTCFNTEWNKYEDDSLYAPQPYRYAEWYKRELVAKPTSQHADKLLQYEFDDIDYPADIEESVMTYQQLDEEYAVLRYLGNRYHRGEVARLFISAKGKPTLMAREGNNWIIKGSTVWYLKSKPVITNKEEMETWKPLQYILPCLGDEITIGNICDYLRHPIVEQLYKSGYKRIAKAITNDGYIFNNLKTYFLVEKETKQPLFKMLGVNKYVLNAAEKCEYNALTAIRELKYFFGQFDISNCSEKIAETIVKYVSSTGYRWDINHISDLVGHASTGYWRSSRYETPLTDDERKWVLKLIRMEEKEEGCIRTYKDAIRTYNIMDIKPDIDLYNVHDLGDITRLHDALVRLQTQENMEKRARYDEHQRKMKEAAQKQFEKLQETRIGKFEYENDEYCIRVPHELDEITKEGMALHHCVGGYLNRHANGETNIIFLRKKGAEDTPWFTVEINNGNHVVQIHGSHNRWLGNEPEAVPFVYEWLTKIEADFDKRLLLNKGAGYGMGKEFLPETALYAAA